MAVNDDRMSHPRLDLTDPYADDVDDTIRAAITASPTGAVRIYSRDSAGEWDTDDTADIVTVVDGMLLAVDLGSDG